MKTRILILVLILFYMPLMLAGQKTDKKPEKTTITGFVTDAKQNPVKGAIILIDKNKTSSVTDKKGFYKVKTHPDAGLITILSFDNGIGEASIEGRTTINFTLTEITSSQKDEYDYINLKNRQHQPNKINTEDDKYAGYSDIYEMLRGAVPGVTVTGNSINIRGASSFTLSTEPLFIVDGVQVSSITGIHPSEVKSIEVLKGSATTIYGSQGACGVIKITTKGSAGNK
ncbi:MAG: TonB-dependent receptor plug domain-containing protein [Bacteroidales bacterium]|nr:TonB-dependent receptor plug domain-containing protein [Bacteroidales bacterium]